MFRQSGYFISSRPLHLCEIPHGWIGSSTWTCPWFQRAPTCQGIILYLCIFRKGGQVSMPSRCCIALTALLSQLSNDMAFRAYVLRRKDILHTCFGTKWPPLPSTLEWGVSHRHVVSEICLILLQRVASPSHLSQDFYCFNSIMY